MHWRVSNRIHDVAHFKRYGGMGVWRYGGMEVWGWKAIRLKSFHLLLRGDPFYRHPELLAATWKNEFCSRVMIKWNMILELIVRQWENVLLGSPAPQRAWSGWTFPPSQLSVVSEEEKVRKGQNAVFGKHHKNLLCHWFWDGQSVQVHKLTQFTQLVHIPRREGLLLCAWADRWQLWSEFE